MTAESAAQSTSSGPPALAIAFSGTIASLAGPVTEGHGMKTGRARSFLISHPTVPLIVGGSLMGILVGTSYFFRPEGVLGGRRILAGALGGAVDACLFFLAIGRELPRKHSFGQMGLMGGLVGARIGDPLLAALWGGACALFGACWFKLVNCFWPLDGGPHCPNWTPLSSGDEPNAQAASKDWDAG